MLIASDVRSEIFSDPNSPLTQPGLWLDYLLTFIWIVGITAAFSILDHMDGLCAGVAAVAAAWFAIFAISHGQVFVATLAAVLLGASIGFLGWNFNPARIFLGDAGAMFLGFMMAAVGLKLRFLELPHQTSWMIPVVILGLPIFDTTLVTISRLRRGLVPFSSPGKDHLAHRLTILGLSHRAAALAVYASGAVLGFAALVISWLPVLRAYVVFATVAAAAFVLIAALERVPFERQSSHA
jgi:UDP-GlcNAc:undecaprenyl-phosphate GlcNAc-1-phosphate transferase